MKKRYLVTYQVMTTRQTVVVAEGNIEAAKLVQNVLDGKSKQNLVCQTINVCGAVEDVQEGGLEGAGKHAH